MLLMPPVVYSTLLCSFPRVDLARRSPLPTTTTSSKLFSWLVCLMLRLFCIWFPLHSLSIRRLRRLIAAAWGVDGGTKHFPGGSRRPARSLSACTRSCL